MAIVKEYNLIFTDVVKNNNKYWYGICLDDGTGYSLWGRVGGSESRTNYPSHRVVEQKYNGKIKKGYEPLKIIKTGETKVTQVSNVKEVAKKQIKINNNPILSDLVDRLVSFNIHNITSNTTIKYDAAGGVFSTPLGLVVQEGIDDARKLLVDIHKFVKKDDYEDAKLKTSINKYLKLIPQNIGFKKINIKTLFPSVDSIQKQNDILDSLEVSLKSITQTPDDKKTIEEKIFDTELDYLDLKDPEAIRLIKYYDSTNQVTHGYTHVKVKNIFKIKIQSNIDKFKESKPLVEVFHGTSGANCLSILKSGLRAVPPSTAAIAGAMFGPGVYGATDSSKSLQYTTGRLNKGTSMYYMFICDFSMGKYYDIKSYGGKKPAGYDSIWAKAKNTGLRFDELIVPDNHVKIKYLLELN